MGRFLFSGLIGIFLLGAGLGCGKEPPLEKEEPMRKGRIPSRTAEEIEKQKGGPAPAKKGP